MKRLSLRLFSLVCLAAAAGLALTGCQKPATQQTSFQPGEVIVAGPLTYNVVQTAWRTDLGEVLSLRTPEQRFLLITVAASNKGHESLSLPFFTLEGENHREYPEIQNGAGVDNWFGIIRELGPGENRQGNILFDVPLTSYRLRLSDGGVPGTEKFVWVDIPLNLDTNVNTRVDLAVPMPGPK